ncbi:calcium/sodium antiporter [Rubripirellula reticaptiva]|uniref:Inner membrane protein YrbG n=1 Tax=Rubripirellula reticaptiva TaxID=2528013 RepID=A0A5C6EH83_9BACT|nr:calcium/sodium antiporter [Rubripirellula reticaptiva]TWU46966.1 Inner membrane protein YrbG [Rubripirellula reticaptiva]
MVYPFLILGLAVLVVGAELLVRGAVTLAEIARISPLIVGLTVVAFGTSAPELAVSAIASLKGDSAIALGNVVGSNIFNLLLILGISALIVPLSVSSQLIRFDVPIMIAVSVLTLLAAVDGEVGRGEGFCMLLMFATYTGWLIRAGRQESAATVNDSVRPLKLSMRNLLVNIAMLMLGLALLVWGAKLLVDSATTIARSLGVTDTVIGLTIVAAGTSLPEMATSVVAAIRGQRDIAVGNVVGSNIFNLLMVLATASIVSKGGVPVTSEVLLFDVAVMVLTAFLCLPVFFSHASVSRAEGALMLLMYVTYTSLLIAASQNAPWSSLAKSGFVFAVFPLACIAVSGRAWFHRNAASASESKLDGDSK